MNLSLNHFSLCNTWIGKDEGAKYGYPVSYFEHTCDRGQISFVVDAATKDRYIADSCALVRVKCTLIFAACFIVHPIAAAINIAHLALKIVSCKSKNFDELLQDIARICLTPFVLIGMLFALAYGAIFSPYDGRKLYGSLERYYYHSSIIAPCFQPSNQNHERAQPCNCLS